MFFLNLGLGEFLTLLGAVAGTVTALYLLDRASRKKRVSTLRFWVNASRVDEQQRRKRIREPWSFMLQLLSLTLLLLAIAQLQWGSRERDGRNHVIVLDTSSAMAQRRGDGVLLDEVKQQARRYVSLLPARDRAMVIRADGLATPVTSLTDHRQELYKAIDESAPSWSALNLSAALELGYRALRWSQTQGGEVVYVGGTRVAQWSDERAQAPVLRSLLVNVPSENVGIRRLAVKRDPDAASLWQASVAIRNYGANQQRAGIRLHFGSTDFEQRVALLAPGEEQTLDYKFTTTGPGTLTATLSQDDDLRLDNSARLQIPATKRLRVFVYSARPDDWQPLFESDRRLETKFLPPGKFANRSGADVVVLDGFAPAVRPDVPALWVAPPAGRSPIPAAGTQRDAVLTRWAAEGDVGQGLHSKELHVSNATLLAITTSDIPVAGTEQGAVIAIRPAAGGAPRFAVVGFDPIAGALRYEVSTPLLFAHLLQWLEPEDLHVSELVASAVGNATVVLDRSEKGAHFRVIDEKGFALPFTVRTGLLQFFTPNPGVVRVVSPQRERILSLTLPEVAEYRWTPPPDSPQGLPGATWFGRPAVDLWKWLALLGTAGLICDWLFFGKQRPLRWRPVEAHPLPGQHAGEELARR